MHLIHAAKVAFRICIDQLQARGPPRPAKVNPEVTVVRERIADPVAAGAALRYDNNMATVVEIPDGEAAPSARPVTDGFNDQRIVTSVRRPRDTGQKSKVCERVRNTYGQPGQVHLTA